MALTADLARPLEDVPVSERRFLFAGLAVSLLAHALAAILLMGIHLNVPEPPVTPIEVELVPAEEQQVPEQTPPEPETPAEQEQQEEEAASEAAPPPPPPPPPPAERTEAAQQPVETEVPVLKPVEEFGEEDTGPKDREESSEPQTETADEPVGSEEQPETAAGPEDAPAGETEEGQPVEDEVQAVAEIEDIPGQEPEAPAQNEEETEPQSPAEVQAAQDEDTPVEDFGTVGPIVTAALPAPKPAPPPRSSERETSGGGGGQGGGSAKGMTAARELYSQDILDDPRARTAMRGMPEGQRLNLLCMTELRAQLTVASPAPPELLPSFRPRGGTVLEPARAAFRMGGRWFDVAFRCETDSEVTKVRKFSFRIGKVIPPSQWAERGLTGF